MTDQPDGLTGLVMAVTGGGVDFDSAAGLHAWVKDINAYEEDEMWDMDPALALLFTDQDEPEETGEIVVCAFKPMEDIKPWRFLTPVGAALLKLVRDRHPKARPRAAAFFCEAWGYSVPVEPGQTEPPPDWKDAPREEMKTVMTLDVRNPYTTVTAVRFRGQTEWEEDKTQVYDQGNVANSMRELAKFVSRKNRSLKDLKLFRLPEDPQQEPDQPSD